MHSLPSGNWIKDLELGKRPIPNDHWGYYAEVVGSKEMLAVVLWERIVFFWEVKGDEMKQLNPLLLGNLRCFRGGIQVCGTKTAILARGPGMGGMASLIVMEKGKRGLVKKTLSNFTLKALWWQNLLALNDNFIASVIGELNSGDPDTKIALWGGEKRLSDVVLPGSKGQKVTGIILEPPYVAFLQQAIAQAG